jgi:hypothetical protein
MPAGTLDLFDPEFIFTNSASNVVEARQQEGPDNNTFTFILPEGEYTLLVKARKDGVLVAEGRADVIIIAGKAINNVTVTLHPIVSGGGTGTLTFTLRHNNPGQASFEIDAFTLSPIPIIANDEPIDVLKLPGSPNDERINIGVPYTVHVPAGYYLLSITLVKTLIENQNSSSSLANKSEAAHIYRNLDTIIDYDFTDINFIDNIVTNNLDNDAQVDEAPIPGSLRYALEHTSWHNGKAAIRVMLPPGSEIKLKRNLDFYAYGGDLTIEGNGIILSKSSDAWEDMYSSRLITTNNPDYTMTIRRVHFKGSDGGAIENYGNLSLESCIFSGNKAEGRSFNGGAIENNGTLTVKGCTFYDNHADGGGGAIYNGTSGQIKELTGNLFFVNTGSNRPVIFNNNDMAGINSGGYNAVDVTLGTGTNQSGWAAGTGDTTFSGKGISGDPINKDTFAPVPGLSAIIPPDLPDFPTTDFYGKDRKWPGAPGAVNGD